MSERPVIDACVNHTWASQLDIMPYMNEGWREYLGAPGLLPNGGGMVPISPGLSFRRKAGDKRAEAAPANGVAGSDRTLLAAQIFGSGAVSRAVLGFDSAALATAVVNPYLSAQVAMASNRWTLEHWVEQDSRFASLMLIASQVPDQAAAEIRRVGRHRGIAGVLMGGNGLGKAYGHPVFHGIYEAAAEMDLPIVFKAGSEGLPDSPALTAAGSEPATYAEFRVMEYHPLMTHVTTLVTQGVFSKYPNLKVMIVGGGAMWVPPFLWRLDAFYKGLRREVPWVKRLPSDYIREHVRFGTYPLDRLPDSATQTALNSIFDHLEEMLVYTSGYPNWDSNDPAEVAATLPPAARRKVMHDNALSFFRFDGTIPAGALAAGTEQLARGDNR